MMSYPLAGGKRIKAVPTVNTTSLREKRFRALDAQAPDTRPVPRERALTTRREDTRVDE